eukprot:CAMPEP_0179437052 /NCGR_PEP_ID=MMETSP0799-20121207/21005_1 /TAXON_ID=46947 /ORGANISM="Geminigera cryophila, Strain CCMP2564" /LENGTH=38 /DNA_ID= /DNA_START= /DNA_END= /DNA_ORIENTATION=
MIEFVESRLEKTSMASTIRNSGQVLCSIEEEEEEEEEE